MFERLLTNFGGLGEVHQSHQRLFEKRDGLAVPVARERTLARHARIHQRGVPAVSFERMMREPIYMVVQAVREHDLNSLGGPGVQSAPPVVEQPRVRHLVRQRVLERILKVREEPRLVEELGRLESVEAITQRLVWQLGNRLEQHEGHELADYRGDLQEAFVVLGEPIDAGGEDRLHAGGDVQGPQWLRQAMRSPVTTENLRFHQ